MDCSGEYCGVCFWCCNCPTIRYPVKSWYTAFHCVLVTVCIPVSKGGLLLIHAVCCCFEQSSTTIVCICVCCGVLCCGVCCGVCMGVFVCVILCVCVHASCMSHSVLVCVLRVCMLVCV